MVVAVQCLGVRALRDKEYPIWAPVAQTQEPTYGHAAVAWLNDHAYLLINRRIWHENALNDQEYQITAQTPKLSHGHQGPLFS